VAPVAVVTGAGRMRGIGYATARLLAGDGYTVVLTERPGSSPTEAESGCGWTGAKSGVDAIVGSGGRAVAVACDVTDPGDLADLVERTVELGPLAVLVNNAGSAGQASTFAVHEAPEDVWAEAIEVNLHALHRIAVAAIPALIASEAADKAIVNLASLAGSHPLARYGSYSASKAGVIAVTSQMALELARYGIRVNCVSPGSTDTDMIDGTLDRAERRAGMAPGSVRDLSTKRIPLRRFADPAEVGEVIRFLAGARSSYVTGQTLLVDGGLSLI
jgi:NAD(P)-dependent dehydrogenase (short-subunit alcohol dehydrogenase family)